jgi:hypothetical protein
LKEKKFEFIFHFDYLLFLFLLSSFFLIYRLSNEFEGKLPMSDISFFVCISLLTSSLSNFLPKDLYEQ